MAASITWLGAYAGSVSQTAHTLSVTWGGGTGKVVVLPAREQTRTISSVTVNGTSMGTAVTSATHSGSAGALQVAAYVLDGVTLSAGTYDVVVTINSAEANISFGVWRIDDAATGTQAFTTAEAPASTQSTVSSSLSCVPDGAVVAAFVNSSGTPTWNTYAGVTERLEQNETNYTSAYADSLTTATETRTVSGTCNDTTGNKLMVAVSFAPAGGGGGGGTVRRRTTIRTPANTQRAFKPQSRMLFGSTKLEAGPPAPSAGGYRLRRAPRGGQ